MIGCKTRSNCIGGANHYTNIGTETRQIARDNRTSSHPHSLPPKEFTDSQERHSEVYTIVVCLLFLQIVIRVRGIGIDVPVWVEREVLHVVKISDFLSFFFLSHTAKMKMLKTLCLFFRLWILRFVCMTGFIKMQYL